MAKYQTKAFTGVKSVPQPWDGFVGVVAIDVDFPTTALAASDLIELVELPPGVQVVDYAFVFPDIDTGTPTFAFSIGTENTAFDDLATVWEAGLTAGQSAAIVRAGTSAAAQQVTTAARRVAMKVTTIAATYAGAGKTGQVLLHLRG